ncbi:MAG: hypothetical protein QM640_14920 [Niabella sp.]
MALHITKILEIDAKGGPGSSLMGSDGHERTSTQAGRFIINSIEKHVSPGRYAFWSGVPWGTPMRLTNGSVEIKLGGTWKLLTSLNKWSAHSNNQAAVTKEIVNYYRKLGYKSAFPNKWVFNDFGHISVKYFKDINGDRRLNGKESIMGDFIHTTPFDEAYTTQSKPINLGESHGCIHVKPNDIDMMISKGYLARGNTIEVHDYFEQGIPASLFRKDAKPFFEFHFFPGIYKAAVYQSG